MAGNASPRDKVEGNGLRRNALPSDEEGKRAMGFVWTLIIGLLAGIVAKFLMPGRDPGGFIITMLLGVAGAFVATWLGQTVGWYQAGEGAGFVGAVVGAIILLLAYRMLKARRA
jgi:uncharacterized membrane protein YeaQ/YmgE (transglycosylase-associated protein family)